jgi:DNA mismatch endonuclease (patch repair protein)
MQRQRRTDTGPEMILRSLVWATGLRYRVDARPVATFRRRADLVFRRARVAVFVDGCFWHGCKRHRGSVAGLAAWWKEKIGRNRFRDRETDRILAREGWQVIRLWEHDISRDAAACASRVTQAVRSRVR